MTNFDINIIAIIKYNKIVVFPLSKIIMHKKSVEIILYIMGFLGKS